MTSRIFGGKADNMEREVVFPLERLLRLVSETGFDFVYLTILKIESPERIIKL